MTLELHRIGRDFVEEPSTETMRVTIILIVDDVMAASQAVDQIPFDSHCWQGEYFWKKGYVWCWWGK